MRAPRRVSANNRGRARRLAALAGALIGLSALAACSGAPADGAAELSSAEPAVSAPEDAATTGEDQKTAALTPEGERASKIDADPKRLIGLDRNELTALLGEPAFRRKDNPAEFWRYRGESCMLDLFLYGPEKVAAKDKAVRVRHVAARGLTDTPVAAGECLRTILRARLARNAG